MKENTECQECLEWQEIDKLSKELHLTNKARILELEAVVENLQKRLGSEMGLNVKMSEMIKANLEVANDVDVLLVAIKQISNDPHVYDLVEHALDVSCGRCLSVTMIEPLS